MTEKTKDESHSKQQAEAQLESIQEELKILHQVGKEGKVETEFGPVTYGEWQDQMREGVLEVSVREDWHRPGISLADFRELPQEYKILLCWGGPAVRIVGELDQGQPITARIEHQDWFVPWTELPTDSEQEEDLMEYASLFWWRA